MKNLPFSPNESKNLAMETSFGIYERYPVKTHVVMPDDTLKRLAARYLSGYTEPGDIVFVSEKVVAITQGRAFPVEEIRPGFWARLLSRFVHKTPCGIGLGMPCTMELALGEIGLGKVLFAAACSAITKLVGVKGVFYRILGESARAIDGPCDCTIPPYNRYAKLAPFRPDEAARDLAGFLGVQIVVIDANDFGVEVLGRSDKSISFDFCKQVFRDNPLGQCAEQTPLCIVRKA